MRPAPMKAMRRWALIPSLLTFSAEVRLPPAGLDRLDPVPVPWADRVRRTRVHAQVVPVHLDGQPLLLQRLRHDRRRPLYRAADGMVQFRDLLRRYLGALAEWVEAGFPENFVRVGVADAGDDALVRDDVLDHAPVLANEADEVLLRQLWVHDVRPHLRPPP